MNYVEIKGEKYEIKEGFLDLGLLSIANISEIKGLEKIDIKHLELSSNEIQEIKNLEHLKSLEILNLGSNSIIEISGLSKLERLEVLHLASNQIKEIKGLEKLVNLKELYLRGNQIE
ncbi:MAG: leucine-rich repeat protein, partial [Promethearchaeota archaeon]